MIFIVVLIFIVIMSFIAGARSEGKDVGRTVDCEKTDRAREDKPWFRFQETSAERGILGAQCARGRAGNIQGVRGGEVPLLLG